MHNDLIQIGPFILHGYGFMIGIGVLIGTFIAIKRAPKRNCVPDEIVNLIMVCFVSGLIGAKILYSIVEFPALLKNPDILFNTGGFVVFGGIIAGIVATYYYCRWKGLSFLDYFDLLIPSFAFAQGCGRLGCFLAGCCYGKETSSVIGIVFTSSAYAPNFVKLWPTQLMMSIGMFILAGYLFFYASVPHPKGKVGYLYILIYSIGRFVVEFFRGDPRGFLGFLSTSQWIAIVTGILGFYLFFRKKKSS